MQFFHFDSFQKIPGLRHAVSTRELKNESGSDLEYSSFNLAFHVGDDPNAVCENRLRLAHALGYDGSTPVAAQQIHGANCEIVTRENSGRGALDWDSALPKTDALITRETQIPLLILVADCAPILMVDPTQKVLAVVHAGWRGALAGIASKVVQKMELEWNSNAEEILCGIGPCLCAACLEVGDEVASLMPRDCILSGWEKPHLYLRALIQRDLARSGVLPAHIETMAHCPKCDLETFFSHRGQNGKAGRFGLVAWWE